MRSHLTIRNLPKEVAKRLGDEQDKQGLSLNRTVIVLLRRALGLGTAATPENGLGALAGTWTDAEHREFERGQSMFEQIDEELWR